MKATAENNKNFFGDEPSEGSPTRTATDPALYVRNMFLTVILCRIIIMRKVWVNLHVTFMSSVCGLAKQ